MNDDTGSAPTEPSQPLISPIFLRKVMTIIVILGVLTLLLSFGGQWFTERMADGGYSADASMKSVDIGSNQIALPANMIRFANQLNASPVERLDLHLVWPQLEGYSRANRQIFVDSSKSDQLIFLSLAQATMALDMSARLGPVYSKLVSDGSAGTNAGLTAYGFDRGTRYPDEVLYVGTRSNAPPFAARCLKDTDLPKGSRACMRDVNIHPGLTLTYRFSTSLLADWKQLDSAIQSFVKSAITMQNASLDPSNLSLQLRSIPRETRD